MDNSTPPTNPRLFTFLAGHQGKWVITKTKAIVGAPLPPATRIDIINGNVENPPQGTAWIIQGATSNERYVTHNEKQLLLAKQTPIETRPNATQAAIILIRKNENWWALTQNERRAIFEDTSQHIKTGMKYLPAIARRLHHCRDLPNTQPFDFITYFDFPPQDTSAFDEMLAELRATQEWKFIDREFDIRLTQNQ